MDDVLECPEVKPTGLTLTVTIGTTSKLHFGPRDVNGLLGFTN